MNEEKVWGALRRCLVSRGYTQQAEEPLLFGITQEDPAYIEAKRLLKFLDYFVGVDSNLIPNNSILREFIGGSCFRV